MEGYFWCVLRSLNPVGKVKIRVLELVTQSKRVPSNLFDETVTVIVTLGILLRSNWLKYHWAEEF